MAVEPKDAKPVSAELLNVIVNWVEMVNPRKSAKRKRSQMRTRDENRFERVNTIRLLAPTVS